MNKRTALSLKAGFTLIEVLVGLAVMSIVVWTVFETYGNVLQIVAASQYNSTALDIIESDIEAIRNMRYEDVGTIGGIPAGILPATRSLSFDSTIFVVHTYIRNIDDPFDGTLGGTPNDTSPADYKLVQLEMTCDTCPRYQVVSMATYVAPKTLETTSRRGALVIKVQDSYGQPVTGALVHLTNPYVNPAVNVTDTTDVSGQLSFIDVATSSAHYHIVVSKNGYSTDQTYPIGGAVTNPTKPDSTVANQQVTTISLAIDRTSTLDLTTTDQFCAAVPNFDFSMIGSKLIGTSPDTPKYNVSSSTGNDGHLYIDGLEWDTYAFKPIDNSYSLAGVFTSLTKQIDPNSASSQKWYARDRHDNALTLSIRDGSGNPISDANITLSRAGFSMTEFSGQDALSESTWPSYTDKSSGLSVGDGLLTLTDTGSGYATSSAEWLESRTFDMGTASVSFKTLSFNGNQPAPTTIDVQIAANNNNATWNYVGPDGTGATYFTGYPQTIPSSLSGNRWLRYRATLGTSSPAQAPTLNDITIIYRSECIPPDSAYFDGLAASSYTLSVEKNGYQTNNETIDATSNWQYKLVTLQQ